MENVFFETRPFPATIHKVKDAYFNIMMMLSGASCFLSYRLGCYRRLCHQLCSFRIEYTTFFSSSYLCILDMADLFRCSFLGM
jgi:hypothetical protein